MVGNDFPRWETIFYVGKTFFMVAISFLRFHLGYSQFFSGAAFVGQILQNVLMEMLPRTMGLLLAKDMISFSICHSVSILWGGKH